MLSTKLKNKILIRDNTNSLKDLSTSDEQHFYKFSLIKLTFPQQKYFNLKLMLIKKKRKRIQSLPTENLKENEKILAYLYVLKTKKIIKKMEDGRE